MEGVCQVEGKQVSSNIIHKLGHCSIIRLLRRGVLYEIENSANVLNLCPFGSDEGDQLGQYASTLIWLEAAN